MVDIEGTGAAGIQIKTPNNTDGGIYFRTGSSNPGAISYLHTSASETLNFRSGGYSRISIDGTTDSNNNVIHLRNNSYDDGVLQYYNGGLYLKTGSSNGDRLISFHTAGTQRLYLDSSGHLVFAGTSEEIKLGTSDGSDTGYLNLSGGGACAQTRGAQVVMYGNEKSSEQGRLLLMAGNSGSANGSIDFYTGGANRGTLSSAGSIDISNTASNAFHSLSNYDHGNNTYSHRNARVLTSNGTGWDGNESSDGADPILILSVTDRAGNSDIGDAYGLCLHSESQDDDDYGPLIGWSNRSNSGNYNTTYAAIVGQKTGQAADHNWSSGALHFFTNKGSGYMDSTADLSITQQGYITKPRNCAFKSNNTNVYGSAGSLTTTVANVAILLAGEEYDHGNNYNTTSKLFTCPVDGVYLVNVHVSVGNIGSSRQIWVMAYTLGGGSTPLSSYVEVIDGNTSSYANYSYCEPWYFTAGTTIGVGKNNGSGTLSGQNMDWGVHLLG